MREHRTNGRTQEVPHQHNRQIKEQNPVEQLRKQKEHRMTICISIQPEHTQDSTKEAQLSRTGRLAALTAFDLPVLKLRKTEQQKHQPINEIRAQKIRTTINSGAEQECSSGDRSMYGAKISSPTEGMHCCGESTSKDDGACRRR